MPRNPRWRDAKAETALVSSILQSPAILDELWGLISKEDLGKSAARLVDGLDKAYRERGGLDLVIATPYIMQSCNCSEETACQKLNACLAEEITPSNWESYAKAIRENTIKAKLLELAGRMTDGVLEPGCAVGDLLDDVQRDLVKLSVSTDPEETSGIDNLVIEVYENIANEKPPSPGLPTGFTDLDKLTGGFHRGEYIVLAARPSLGKTTLALNICRHMAEDGKRILIFSIEMPKVSLICNMIAFIARVNADHVRRAKVPQRQLGAIAQAAGQLSKMKIRVRENQDLTPWTLRRMARREYLDEPFDVVVVDYMQLMSVPRSGGRTEEVTQISGGLKALARELNVSVLAISQLTRASSYRDDKRPRLSELRESGAIEQDADVVLLLHRDDYYDPKQNRGVAEINLAKQRNGPRGHFKLAFIEEELRFENYAPF